MGKNKENKEALETNLIVKYWCKNSVAKLKSVIPSLIASQQTAHVQNRYNGEAGRLISDILVIFDKLSIDGYLVTVDIEKHFRLPWSWIFADRFKKNWIW